MVRPLSAKRTREALGYSKLDPTILSKRDIAAGQPEDPLINVNELLPSHVLKLLDDTKMQLKPEGFKYIRTRNFTVDVKFSNAAPVQIVITATDIAKIAQ